MRVGIEVVIGAGFVVGVEKGDVLIFGGFVGGVGLAHGHGLVEVGAVGGGVQSNLVDVDVVVVVSEANLGALVLARHVVEASRGLIVVAVVVLSATHLRKEFGRFFKV